MFLTSDDAILLFIGYLGKSRYSHENVMGISSEDWIYAWIDISQMLRRTLGLREHVFLSMCHNQRKCVVENCMTTTIYDQLVPVKSSVMNGKESSMRLTRIGQQRSVWHCIAYIIILCFFFCEEFKYLVHYNTLCQVEISEWSKVHWTSKRYFLYDRSRGLSLPNVEAEVYQLISIRLM